MASRTGLPALVLAAVLLPVLAQSAEATAPVKLPSMSAAQIVDRNVTARGGLQAWRGVQTMTWKGTMGAGGTTYSEVTPAGKLETKTRPEAMLPFKLDYKRPLKTPPGTAVQRPDCGAGVRRRAGLETATLPGQEHAGTPTRRMS